MKKAKPSKRQRTAPRTETKPAEDRALARDLVFRHGIRTPYSG
jgi:hypothetical protein